MTDVLYTKFVKRWEEVTNLPPQTMGPLTPLYKSATRRLKVMPWPAILAISAVAVIILYLALGAGITFVVSLLQKGF